MTTVGWTLIAGCCVFLVGAAGWKMAYEQPMDQALVAMHHDRGRLRWIHWWMVPAMFLTTAGFVGLAFETGDALVGMAATVFLLGAAQWTTTLLFRLSVGEWAAEATAAKGSPPSVYPALARWAGLGHAVHMVSAYAAAVLLGTAMIGADIVPAWLGWGVLGWGVAMLALYAFPSTRVGVQPPIMAHVATLAVGIAVL